MSALPASSWRDQWLLRPGVTYLNHGSFGPSPKSVLATRYEWIERLESEPMDFFVRQFEDVLEQARHRLGRFVGAKGEHLIFVDNATFGMNLVAGSFPLEAGDEVLATDHEYGAVLRIWRGTCERAGAKLVVQRLPERLDSAAELVEELFAGVSPRTKLLVVSHVTSATAVIFPIARICARAKELGLAVCVDGPHAPAAVPVEIDRLGCDFYTASCHKWLSAPFGSGFLYVHPRWQHKLRPLMVSWGASLSGRPANWVDEFTWSGTRDPSAFLAVPAAIDLLEGLEQQAESGILAESVPEGSRGLELFRTRSHALARYARAQIVPLTGAEPLVPDSPEWYGPMISLPLPEWVGEPIKGHIHPLQQQLWERQQIEVMCTHWRDRRWIRVSCHMYTDPSDIDRLVEGLQELLAESRP